MLEVGGISFGEVPLQTRRELEAGRSGVELALELYQRLRLGLVRNIYLLPPILPGGERNYEAAQEFLEGARALS